MKETELTEIWTQFPNSFNYYATNTSKVGQKVIY